MNLRVKTAVAAAVFALGVAAPAFAAPLFPDVPENHWARDAVATLAAKGIVEGYPDGTFKGDRAATRWEVAMIVARLLAKMEQEHATFATKAELAELQKLVDQLKGELDQLGARVGALENKVDKLDLRVSELERITFYGSVETRLTAQNFHNESDAIQTNNNGMLLNADGTSTGIINYNQAVGSAAGVNLDPLSTGNMPVMDYTRGVGLTNGTGFTMKAILGMRIRVTDDIDAGAQFAAYTSAGDSVVDSLWGVSAPYLANQFGGYADGSLNNNGLYTRMVLDNFWVLHNPSGTKLTLGSYSEDTMDDILFAGQKNIAAFGPQYLDRFGFNLSGAHAFNDAGVLRWEVLGSRIAKGQTVSALDGLVNIADTYATDIIGADIAFEFGGGQVKVNFMRAANEANDGDVLGTGRINPNAFLAWVNPNGYWAGQVELGTIDADGNCYDSKQPMDLDYGNVGPQSMFGYGISANYKWDIGETGNEIYAAGEYAHTEYKPNKNSDYSSDGNAYRIEVGTNLLEGDLDLSLAYLSVDPTYDPFVNNNPIASSNMAIGSYSSWRMPSINYYTDMWSLHDTDVYPHNRQGIRFNGQWRFMERHGLVWAKANFLGQTKSSLYDVREYNGANAVLGYNPGFMDPVFYGYAAPEVYGARSADNFDVNLNALDDHKGKQTNWGLGVSYKWDSPRIKVDLGYESNEYKRDASSGLVANDSQNYVKLHTDNIHVGLGWEANDQWTLRAGCDMANMTGHWDPYGLYNQYALAANASDFDTLDVQQTIPFVGFDYDISANTQWNLDFRYYDTKDKMDASTYANVYGAAQAAGATNAGYTANPFSWSGWQVTTQFKVKF